MLVRVRFMSALVMELVRVRVMSALVMEIIDTVKY